MQVFFCKAIETPKQILTVVGQDYPNLKMGPIRIAETLVAESDILRSLIHSYNKSSFTYYFKNGSILEFKAYEKRQDAKQGKRDYLFVNEANGISKEIFEELHIRTGKQTYIDYNPNTEFWVHDELIGKPGVRLIISDYRHNPYCPDKIKMKLEALKLKDLESWFVYARGKTGKISGIIFRNWDVVPFIPQEATLIAHGLDFGFTNDPTACISVYKYNGALWLKETLYPHADDSGWTNPEIVRRLKAANIKPHEAIVADSAEPKSIAEISGMGMRIEPAKKGPDSIKQSIDILKRYDLKVTQDSVNLKRELSRYKWATDKDGHSINEPVDFDNHLMDALRYVALNRLNNNNSGKYAVFNV